MSHPERSDVALMVAARDDPEAFADVYRRHSLAVMTYLRSRLTDVETAADLTADVFAAAWVSRTRYRPELGPPRAWLLGIANHRLSTQWRRQRRAAAARRRLGVPRLEFEDAALERVDAVVGTALQRGVEAFVDDLPPDQRAAVLARVVDEQGYDAIAARSGVPESAVRKRVSRGLASLAGVIGKQET